MTGAGCERYRGLLAMEVVGRTSSEERLALSAHTDGCAACRQERQDLAMLSVVLPAADPDHVGEHELPLSLRSAVLDRLGDDGRAYRHRRRTRIVIGAAAAVVVAGAVVVAVVAVVAALTVPSHSAARTITLVGLDRVHATVRLTPEPWGTALELRESGQQGGEVLSVAMKTVSGSWWPTGTYRTGGASVRVTMACALKMAEIRGVWVSDSGGKVVLHGYLDLGADRDASAWGGPPGPGPDPPGTGASVHLALVALPVAAA